MREPTTGHFEQFRFCLEIHFLDGRQVRGWFRTRDELDRYGREAERSHAGHISAVLGFELLAVGGPDAEAALPEAICSDTVAEVDISALPCPGDEADEADEADDFDAGETLVLTSDEAARRLT